MILKELEEYKTELIKEIEKSNEFSIEIIDSIYLILENAKRLDKNKRDKSYSILKSYQSDLKKTKYKDLEEYKILLDEPNKQTLKYIKNLKNLKNYIDRNKSVPTINLKVLKDKKLGQFIKDMRKKPEGDIKREIVLKTIEGYSTTIRKTKDGEFQEKLEEIKQFMKDNNDCIPSIKNEEGLERSLGLWIDRYTNDSLNITPEKRKIVKELIKGKMSTVEYTNLDFFEARKNEIIDYIKNNEGFIPGLNKNDEEENRLAMWLQNYTKASSEMKPERIKIMKDIVKGRETKYNSDIRISFEEKVIELKEFIKNNDCLPSNAGDDKERELSIWLKDYIAKNSEMLLEKQKIVKTIIKGKSHKKHIVEDKINNILTILEGIVEKVSLEKDTKSIILDLQNIIEIYEVLTIKDKKEFDIKNRAIRLYLDKLLTRKEDYENITIEELNNIKKTIIEEIESNPTVKAAYLAMLLQDSIAEDKDTQLEEKVIEEELFSLNKILKFLKFKDKNNTSKDIIIKGFKEFIENNFLHKNADGKNVKIDGWMELEIKSHFITFFENFNENDFEILKEKSKGKTNKEFFEHIMELINDSTLSISTDEINQKKGVFEKKYGKYIYNPGSGGELDLFASYNKQVFTGSTTGLGNINEMKGRGEGKQLLLHPLKAIGMLNLIEEFILEESQDNKKIKKENNKVIFTSGILKGLSFIMNGLQNIKIKIEDEKELYLKDLSDDKLENMNSSFLLLKTILEQKKYGNNKTNKQELMVLQKKIRDYYKSTKTSNSHLKLLGFKATNRGVERKINEEYVEYGFKTNVFETKINPIFDIPNLTLRSLNEESNKLLVSLQLNLIRDYHLENTESDFIKNYQIRAPYIKDYNVNLNDRLERVEILGQSLYNAIILEDKGLFEEALKGDLLEYDEKYTKIIKTWEADKKDEDKSFAQLSFLLYVKTLNDMGLETEIEYDFFKKISDVNREELFFKSVRTYILNTSDFNSPNDALSQLPKEAENKWGLSDLKEIKRKEDIASYKGMILNL